MFGIVLGYEVLSPLGGSTRRGRVDYPLPLQFYPPFLSPSLREVNPQVEGEVPTGRRWINSPQHTPINYANYP